MTAKERKKAQDRERQRRLRREAREAQQRVSTAKRAHTATASPHLVRLARSAAWRDFVRQHTGQDWDPTVEEHPITLCVVVDLVVFGP